VAAPRSLHGVGYVEPVSEVRRLTFQHAGVVATRRVAIGERVAAGTVLMTLRAEEDRAAVVEAEAAVAFARAELAQVCAGVNPLQIEAAHAAKTAAEAEAVRARHEFNRQIKLLDDRVSSRAEFDSAEAACRRADAFAAQRASELRHLERYVRDTDRAVAEARVAVAEARLASARARVAEAELRAPCDGVVLECLRHEGEATLGAGEAVLIFADPTRLCVRAEIDETQALALRAGQTAIVSGAALGDRELAGRVTLVKALMGKKTVFAQSATERKDLDALQLLIALPADFSAPIGLEVDVRVLPEVDRAR
jgi:HlyD family secretion protein